MRLFPGLLLASLVTWLALSVPASAATPHADISLDPDQADKLAHSVLLVEKDFPGDWLGLTDVFPEGIDASDLLAKTPACKSSVLALNDAVKDIESERAGRANVSLVRISDDKKDLTASLLIEVYRDEALDDFAGNLKGFYGADAIQCVQDTARSLLGDSKATARATTALVKAPHDGTVLSYDTELPSLKESIHSELVEWVDGNTRLQLNMYGAKDLMTKDLVSGTLAKVVANLDKAAGR